MRAPRRQRTMKTAVIQSYRTESVRPWVRRCLDSVAGWAARSGYDYIFTGDEIFDLCGADYLARVGDNKRSITNLARLELTRNTLRGGYDRVIWLDADVFVFAPEQLRIDVTERYAFCKEIWIEINNGQVYAKRVVNNAAFVFTRNQPDLDFLIAAIRHVVMNRQIESNYQIGVWFLSAMERVLRFGLLRNIGMFSPALVSAIVDGRQRLLDYHASQFGDPVYAANMCLALVTAEAEAMIEAAMERLAAEQGRMMNLNVPPEGAPLVDGTWT